MRYPFRPVSGTPALQPLNIGITLQPVPPVASVVQNVLPPVIDPGPDPEPDTLDPHASAVTLLIRHWGAVGNTAFVEETGRPVSTTGAVAAAESTGRPGTTCARFDALASSNNAVIVANVGPGAYKPFYFPADYTLEVALMSNDAFGVGGTALDVCGNSGVNWQPNQLLMYGDDTLRYQSSSTNAGVNVSDSTTVRGAFPRFRRVDVALSVTSDVHSFYVDGVRASQFTTSLRGHLQDSQPVLLGAYLFGATALSGWSGEFIQARITKGVGRYTTARYTPRVVYERLT